MMCEDGFRQAGDNVLLMDTWSRDAVSKAVRKILLEEIELARPDDLAFLESQVPQITGRIVDCLCSQDDWR